VPAHTNLQTKPTDLDYKSACMLLLTTSINHHLALILIPKADTGNHLTVPQRSEGFGQPTQGCAAHCKVVVYKIHATAHSCIQFLDLTHCSQARPL